MSKRYNFIANINDGGEGHGETFTLEELGIDDSLEGAELEEALGAAYTSWFSNFDMGGWGLAEDE